MATKTKDKNTQNKRQNTREEDNKDKKVKTLKKGMLSKRIGNCVILTT